MCPINSVFGEGGSGALWLEAGARGTLAITYVSHANAIIRPQEGVLINKQWDRQKAGRWGEECRGGSIRWRICPLGEKALVMWGTGPYLLHNTPFRQKHQVVKGIWTADILADGPVRKVSWRALSECRPASHVKSRMGTHRPHVASKSNTFQAFFISHPFHVSQLQHTAICIDHSDSHCAASYSARWLRLSSTYCYQNMAGRCLISS